MSKVVIYSDGASRGNPGEAGIGVVIYSESKSKVKEIAEYIGVKTNNVAEYQALIRGLEEALVLGAKEVQVYADSELMVKQMRGEYKVKNPGLQPLYQKAKLLSLKFNGFQVGHVPREKNKEADLLANKGIDRKSQPASNTNSERKVNQQVAFAFKEPSITKGVDSNLSRELIISGNQLGLSKLQLEVGQENVFEESEETILFTLKGTIKCKAGEMSKIIQKDEGFVITPHEKVICTALENAEVLKFAKLPANRL